MVRQPLRMAAILVVLLMCGAIAPTGAVLSQPSSMPTRQWGITASGPIYIPFAAKLPPPPATLISSADVDVIQGFADSNSGEATRVWVGYHKGGCTDDTVSGGVSRGLIQFDLTRIPVSTSITKAMLNIRPVRACHYTRTSAPVTVYRLTSGWSELQTTWNSQPTTAEAYGSVSLPFDRDQLNKYFALDVTDLLRGWVNGSLPNNGLELRTTESSGNDFAFFGFGTRENPGVEPYLSITYAGAAAAGAPAGGSGHASFTCTVALSGETSCVRAGVPTGAKR